jgi:TolA-binding protein
MFRGLSSNKGILTAVTCLAHLAVFGFAEVAMAKAKGSKRPQGPNQEDYYSTSDKNISMDAKAQADVLRVKTIESIKPLLVDKKIKGPQKFELQLRLGELYAERHDYMRDQELVSYEAKYQKWVQGGKKGTEPKITYEKSKAQLTNAANAFRTLVQQFPKSPRTAAALFALGKTLARLENENSILYFNQLIRDHKNSPLVTDAYLSMGEYYFDKHQVPKAIDSYRMVLKNKTHQAYTYAVYKLGWAYFNATPKNDADAKDNINKSVTSFKLVVRLSERDKALAGRLNLREEAIKDLILVWSETQDTESAWAYFKTIGEKDSFYTLLERLGGIYSDQGNNRKAIEVYQRLLAEAEGREGNPEIYGRLVELHDRSGDTKAAIADLKDMQRLYVKGSNWTIKHGAKKDVIDAAYKLVEFNLHRYGTLFHNRGNKSKSNEMLAGAAAIYSLYLSSFPENGHAYEIRYYLADIQFEFAKYEASSDNYTLVAQARPKDGKYLSAAAMNAVLAMNKLDAQQKYAKLPPAGQVPKPLEIPSVKKKLIVTLDNYVGFLPKSADGYPMRFTAAEVYFNYGQYDVAMARFNKIADELPSTKQGVASVKMILAFQVEKKNWADSATLSRKFLANSSFKDKELRTYLASVLKTATFNQALALAAEEKHKEAALAFMAYRKDFPDDKSADRSLYNASVNFYKASMPEEALMANTTIIEKYEGSTMRPNAFVDVAQTYEGLAQFENSAKFYRRFAVTYPADERAPTALFNAATLYKGLKNFAEAEKNYSTFIRSYPKNALVNDAKWETAQLQEKLKNYAAAAATYREYAQRIGNSDPSQNYLARAKAATIQMNNLGGTKGRKEYETLRSELVRDSKTPAFEARRIIAETAFKEVEPAFAEYRKMTVNDPRKIEAQAQKKQTQLVNTAKRYEAVTSIGSIEFAVASLYRLGQMHEDFSQVLFNAPAPAGSSQVEVDKFKSSIEKVAFPLKEQATQFYETAFKRSQEVETFTVWTQRTYAKMAELAPTKYPAVIEQSIYPNYLEHRLMIDGAVANLAE